jgi:hypothetical protein
MGELQTLWSCTLRSPSSVSKARKRSPEDWVFWDSCIGVGSHVPKATGGAARRCWRHTDQLGEAAAEGAQRRVPISARDAHWC